MLIVFVIVGGVAPGTGFMPLRIIGTVLGVNNHLRSHPVPCYHIAPPTPGRDHGPTGTKRKSSTQGALPRTAARTAGGRGRPRRAFTQFRDRFPARAIL